MTALYVKIDDMLVKDRRPGHPVRLSQSELACLAVAQALPGFHSEHRWIRVAICHLRGCFPYLPHQPGCNKRLRAALPLLKRVIRDLGADSDLGLRRYLICTPAGMPILWPLADAGRVPWGWMLPVSVAVLTGLLTSPLPGRDRARRRRQRR